MTRADQLVHLTPTEQGALQTLVMRLLRADPDSAAAAMSHVTLLWLDWMDRHQEMVSEPMPTDATPQSSPTGVSNFERIQLDDAGPGSAIHEALGILQQLPHRFVVVDFLLDLARANEITDAERRFLAFVRQELATAVPTRGGPYR